MAPEVQNPFRRALRLLETEARFARTQAGEVVRLGGNPAEQADNLRRSAELAAKADEFDRAARVLNPQETP